MKVSDFPICTSHFSNAVFVTGTSRHFRDWPFLIDFFWWFHGCRKYQDVQTINLRIDWLKFSARFINNKISCLLEDENVHLFCLIRFLKNLIKTSVKRKSISLVCNLFGNCLIIFSEKKKNLMNQLKQHWVTMYYREVGQIGENRTQIWDS